MLLAENADGLLPDWAFFARCVVDTTELRPTASREALYEDSLLDGDPGGARRPAARLAGPAGRRATRDRLAEFLDIHHLGVKALALHDDEMLRLVDQWWPMETNVGPMTLAEFRAALRRCCATRASLDEFRQLAGGRRRPGPGGGQRRLHVRHRASSSGCRRWTARSWSSGWTRPT